MMDGLPQDMSEDDVSSFYPKPYLHSVYFD